MLFLPLPLLLSLLVFSGTFSSPCLSTSVPFLDIRKSSSMDSVNYQKFTHWCHACREQDAPLSFYHKCLFYGFLPVRGLVCFITVILRQYSTSQHPLSNARAAAFEQEFRVCWCSLMRDWNPMETRDPLCTDLQEVMVWLIPGSVHLLYWGKGSLVSPGYIFFVVGL